MKIEWRDVPVEIRRVVEPLISKWADFAPRWLDIMYVHYEQDGSPGASLSTNVRHEYRHVNLYVHPAFLASSSRESLVVHELIHVHFDPVHSLCGSIINNQASEEVRELLHEEFRRVMEGMVTDIENAVIRVTGEVSDGE